MRNRIVKWISGILLASCGSVVAAEALPKTGTINLQAINKGTSSTKYNDEYTHGTITGVTFNEQKKGLMHMGKSACSFSVFTHEKVNKSVGFCSYEDKEGDKIFIQYEGTSAAKGEWSGVDEIIGGTGKFKNIRGEGAYSCAGTDKEGEFPCTVKLAYQLP